MRCSSLLLAAEIQSRFTVTRPRLGVRYSVTRFVTPCRERVSRHFRLELTLKMVRPIALLPLVGLFLLPAHALIAQPFSLAKPGPNRFAPSMRSASSNAATVHTVRIKKAPWSTPAGQGKVNAYLHAEGIDQLEMGGCGVEIMRMSHDGLVGGDERDLKPRAIVSGTLHVHPSFRRQGVAQRLLREAENTARGWGCSELVLMVKQNNAAALKLYGKMGYKAMPIHKEHGNEVCMKRNIFALDGHTMASLMPGSLRVKELGR